MNTPNVTLAKDARELGFLLAMENQKAIDNSLKLRENWDQPEK